MKVAARPAVLPRKTPVQARSAASVAAILDATLQVLLAVGKEQLTTTRVAHRAGVSVGTLYQYFPNKRSLLQAVLERHLNGVAEAVELVCQEHHGAAAPDMIAALIRAYFAVKMKHPRASVALYAVSSDVDGARINQLKGTRSRVAMAAMLSSAQPALAGNPELIAALLQGAMAGISRQLLESRSPEKDLPVLQREFIRFSTAYLDAASAAPPATAL